VQLWVRVPRDTAQPESVFAPIIAALFETVQTAGTTATDTAAAQQTVTKDDDDDDDDDDDGDEGDNSSGKPTLIWRAWWTRRGVPTRVPRMRGVHILDDLK
jgi:hypothetical protein